MPHICRLEFLHLENGEELVLAKFEKRVAFAAVELFQIENIFVKCDRFFYVVHLDGDVIASVNLHTHTCSLTEEHFSSAILFRRRNFTLGTPKLFRDQIAGLLSDPVKATRVSNGHRAVAKKIPR